MSVKRQATIDRFHTGKKNMIRSRYGIPITHSSVSMLSGALVGALLCACILACKPAPASKMPGLSLDQGFEALFPTLSSKLVRTLGKSLEADSEEAGKAKFLVASPYAAFKILGRVPATGGSGQNGPDILLVPFAGPALIGQAKVKSMGYDFEGAYALLGTLAAKTIERAQGHVSLKLNCVIIFQANFMREKSALDAFSASFAAKAGPGRLVVKELSSNPESVDAGGAAEAAIKGAAGSDIGLVVLAIDAQAQAESTAAKAVKAKGDGSKSYFVDMSGWDTTKARKGLFAYRIEGDERTLMRKTIEAAEALARGSPVAARVMIPLRVVRPFLKIF